MTYYTSPAIREIVEIEPDMPVLRGSVVDNASIQTMGQENGGFYDAGGDDSFNHEWM